jgi:hypothetical protein
MFLRAQVVQPGRELAAQSLWEIVDADLASAFSITAVIGAMLSLDCVSTA